MNTDATPYSLKGKRVWVAGHRGMVGSALVRRLASEDCELLTTGRDTCDLRRQEQVERWMREMRPQAVVLAAATVGGIVANSTRPAEFIYDNLMIEANVVQTAYETAVEKLLMLGSACIYPRDARQPIVEEDLLSGPLDESNQWYAIAKIAGIKLCQAYRRQYSIDFISAMPNNLYGTGDNFDLESSHVIPALLRKIHDAKMRNESRVTIWGTGTPLREFVYVDDLADALVFLMKNYSDEPHMNIGSGEEVTIRELAEMIAKIVGWSGEFDFDTSRPDGVPRKFVDISRLSAAGWQPRTSLEEGITKCYRWLLDQPTSALRGYSA